MDGDDQSPVWIIGLIGSCLIQTAPRFDAALAKDYPNPACPRDASLNCAKVQSPLPFQLPAFSQWLRDHPDELI